MFRLPPRLLADPGIITIFLHILFQWSYNGADPKEWSVLYPSILVAAHSLPFFYFQWNLEPVVDRFLTMGDPANCLEVHTKQRTFTMPCNKQIFLPPSFIATHSGGDLMSQTLREHYSGLLAPRDQISEEQLAQHLWHAHKIRSYLIVVSVDSLTTLMIWWWIVCSMIIQLVQVIPAVCTV